MRKKISIFVDTDIAIRLELSQQPLYRTLAFCPRTFLLEKLAHIYDVPTSAFSEPLWRERLQKIWDGFSTCVPNTWGRFSVRFILNSEDTSWWQKLFGLSYDAYQIYGLDQSDADYIARELGDQYDVELIPLSGSLGAKT